MPEVGQNSWRQQIRCRLIKLDAEKKMWWSNRRVLRKRKTDPRKSGRSVRSSRRHGAREVSRFSPAMERREYIGVDACSHRRYILEPRQQSGTCFRRTTDEAKVLKVDAEKKRISVGMKQFYRTRGMGSRRPPRPKLKAGDRVNGVVDAGC